jgi:hypothetical protein
MGERLRKLLYNRALIGSIWFLERGKNEKKRVKLR